MRSIHIVLLAVLILHGMPISFLTTLKNTFFFQTRVPQMEIVKYENRKDGGVRYFFVPQDETQPRSEFRWTGPSWTTLLSVAYYLGNGSIRDYAVINSHITPLYVLEKYD